VLVCITTISQVFRSVIKCLELFIECLEVIIDCLEVVGECLKEVIECLEVNVKREFRGVYGVFSRVVY